ncbi:thymidine phosphorylase [Candidatus Kryptobacter tengchongensis]|uniref:thymidine phosphorylase n=1 Tax=Kryptobacter tengchongensis TaxID=1643429 RepID=A0A656D2S7_KRYT1|nr:thymidine phosphorylase [Candidatus Kryptobacter tengchongensis]CUS95838.1 pyrimidine-nucleoside phosphorylase [Candidatus Kryptobacter tengchongensis]
MLPVEIIRKKRDGKKLTKDEISLFINGYLNGTIPDYQMSAFLMAIYFQGMDFEETICLTEIMLNSGHVVDLSDISGIKVDKHSTGGVGDKVSLILAPIVASAGVPVPMISGRGLGHTGGTLDKLESIPGFKTNLSIEEYKKVISEIGVVMIGQTSEIAPADKKIYALRDVTATVESIPLISASIMSKKLAEGIDALVLDVKTGQGAFMSEYEKSLQLAQTLFTIGKNFGKKVIAFITDMNQPLGYAVGNWLEVVESVQCLRGLNVPDLMHLTYVLAGAMIMLGGKANSIEEGMKIAQKVVLSGEAYEKFIKLVEKQGGDVSYIENLEKYPLPKHSIEVKSIFDGYVYEIDALEVGIVSVMLGAGRTKVDDVIDPKAGIVLRKKVGDKVEAGEPLAIFYTDKDDVIKIAKERLSKAFKIKPEKPELPKLIKTIIDNEGIRDWK